MTCIKTGARVRFEDYGIVVPADLYLVGDAVVIRTTEFQQHLAPPHNVADATHVVYADALGREFWRPDLDVFVVRNAAIEEVKT